MAVAYFHPEGTGLVSTSLLGVACLPHVCAARRLEIQGSNADVCFGALTGGADPLLIIHLFCSDAPRRVCSWGYIGYLTITIIDVVRKA